MIFNNDKLVLRKLILVILIFIPLPIVVPNIYNLVTTKVSKAKVLVLGANFTDQQSSVIAQMGGGTTLQILAGLSNSINVKNRIEIKTGQTLKSSGVTFSSFMDPTTSQLIFEASSSSKDRAIKYNELHLAKTLELATEVGLDREQYRTTKIFNELKDLENEYKSKVQLQLRNAERGLSVLDLEKSFQRISETEDSLLKAQQELASINASLSSAQGLLLKAVNSDSILPSNDSDLEQLRLQLFNAKEKAEKLGIVYGSNYPSVVEAKMELSRVEKMIKDYLQKYRLRVTNGDIPSLFSFVQQKVSLEKRIEKLQSNKSKIVAEANLSSMITQDILEIKRKIDEASKTYYTYRLNSKSDPKKWTILDKPYLDSSGRILSILKACLLLSFYAGYSYFLLNVFMIRKNSFNIFSKFHRQH